MTLKYSAVVSATTSDQVIEHGFDAAWVDNETSEDFYLSAVNSTTASKRVTVRGGTSRLIPLEACEAHYSASGAANVILELYKNV